LTGAGEFLCEISNALEAVILLPNRSICTPQFAALSFRDANGGVFVLWFLPRKKEADCWRRLRVRIFHP
jgi:hypothetical protein